MFNLVYVEYDASILQVLHYPPISSM